MTREELEARELIRKNNERHTISARSIAEIPYLMNHLIAQSKKKRDAFGRLTDED